MNRITTQLCDTTRAQAYAEKTGRTNFEEARLACACFCMFCVLLFLFCVLLLTRAPSAWCIASISGCDGRLCTIVV